ncbi:MAG: hypothetical protein HDS27_02810 [Bacteroides sp.]|nr:hypothetical protein [Bacteroides sp.]
MKKILALIFIFVGILVASDSIMGGTSENKNLTAAIKHLKKFAKSESGYQYREAKDYLKLAAEENDGEACFILSCIYQ